MNVHQGAFEASEKKLEIILKPTCRHLRGIPFEKWEAIVKASGARILNKISADRLDAYLLSESSLFVWDNRMLVITCGRTNLIRALPVIINLVGPTAIDRILYKRKNLLFPDDQPSDFEAESAEILKYYPGKSYRLGPANQDHVHLFYSTLTKTDPGSDTTLQIMMRSLPEETFAKFAYKKNGAPIDLVLEQTGLKYIHPQMICDTHFFEPAGFSVNSVNADEYYTIHVTPQPEGSYASYETNLKTDDYSGIADRLLSFFQPQIFSIVLTNSKTETPPIIMPSRYPEYPEKHLVITEESYYEFDCGYCITYLNFETRERR